MQFSFFRITVNWAELAQSWMAMQNARSREGNGDEITTIPPPPPVQRNRPRMEVPLPPPNTQFLPPPMSFFPPLPIGDLSFNFSIFYFWKKKGWCFIKIVAHLKFRKYHQFLAREMALFFHLDPSNFGNPPGGWAPPPPGSFPPGSGPFPPFVPPQPSWANTSNASFRPSGPINSSFPHPETTEKDNADVSFFVRNFPVKNQVPVRLQPLSSSQQGYVFRIFFMAGKFLVIIGGYSILIVIKIGMINRRQTRSSMTVKLRTLVVSHKEPWRIG